MKLRIEPYSAAHYAALDAKNINEGIINQMCGPAYTLMTDEKKPKIIACGGVRVAGIGQAWAKISPEALKDMPTTIIRKARFVLESCIQEEKLYRTYAEASEGVDAKWFNHLGFIHSEKLFVR